MDFDANLQRTVTPNQAHKLTGFLRWKLSVLLCVLAFSESSLTCALAADEPSFTRTQDVVYGRKHGMALTLDVFVPAKEANGAAVIWVVSGGWVSSHEIIDSRCPFLPINELTRRGYTVF